MSISDRVVDWAARNLAWLLLAMAALMVLAVVLILAGNAATARNARETSEEIRLSQSDGCEKVINALVLDSMRSELIDLKRKVLIPQSADLRDLYTVVARLARPGSISEAIAAAAEDENARISYLKQRIATIGKRIPDAPCMTLYPPLSGQ